MGMAPTSLRTPCHHFLTQEGLEQRKGQRQSPVTSKQEEERRTDRRPVRCVLTGNGTTTLDNVDLVQVKYQASLLSHSDHKLVDQLKFHLAAPAEVWENQVQFWLQLQEKLWEGVPLYRRLQRSIHWWKRHAPQFVISLIENGVQTDFHLPSRLSKTLHTKTSEEVILATEILQDYQKSGAVRVVENPESAKHLIPWFIISKPEGKSVKHRLISDCRELNQFCNPEKFTLENMAQIFPVLKRNWWAVKLDLKDAYFHLELNSHLKQFVRLQVGEKQWEFSGACFGLSTLPKLFMSIMKPLQKIWRSKGLMVFVYLDDIILLAPSETQARKGLLELLETLASAGFKISQKKSVLVPTQRIQHLGFIIDFQKGQLEVPSQKIKTIRKELGKLILAEKLSCRKIASILGQVRSSLVALPFLRLVTSQLQTFTNLHKVYGWDFQVEISPLLKQEIKDLKAYLNPDWGRKFLETPKRVLHSDSSTWAWGGVDSSSGKILQEFWRGDHTLHINAKELKAAILTIKSFAKKGEHVLLNIDNQVAMSYIKKWGGERNI